MQELGEHGDEESIGILEESDVEEEENAACLQENYNSLCMCGQGGCEEDEES